MPLNQPTEFFATVAKTKKNKHLLNRTVWTLNITTLILAGGALYVYGAHNEWIQGAVTKAKSSQAVHGRVVSETAPASATVAKARDISYQHYTGFANLDSLASDAKKKTKEVLRGFVAMPKTNSSAAIYMPIYEGTSNHVLSIGAGVGKPNRTMGQGNFPVFAHNMGDSMTANPSFFSPLQTMRQTVVGSKVYTTNAKDIYTWQIKSLQTRIPDSSIEIMDDTKDAQLTMVACQEDAKWWANYRTTGETSAPYRIVVQSDLKNVQHFNDAPDSVQALFPDVLRDNVLPESTTHDVFAKASTKNVETNWQNATVAEIEKNGLKYVSVYGAFLTLLNIINFVSYSWRRR
jgi:Sortase (surface protein transpeptidase)